MLDWYCQLVVIVFMDIVGYFVMMQQDEICVIIVWERYCVVFDELMECFGGCILQYYGDGILSIFQFVVVVVECFVEM